MVVAGAHRRRAVTVAVVVVAAVALLCVKALRYHRCWGSGALRAFAASC
jgi:hypothetical protein